MTEHSKEFPPSGAWAGDEGCSQWQGSDETTQASQDGTRRHAIMEAWIRHRIAIPVIEPPWPQSVVVDGKEEPVQAVDIEQCSVLLSYLRDHPVFRQAGEYGYHAWVEKKVNYGKPLQLEGEHFGTPDLVLQTPNQLEVIDWKFGMAPVTPPTAQGMMYSLGAGGLLDWNGDARQVRELKLTIGQPLHPNGPYLHSNHSIDEMATIWLPQVKKWIEKRHTEYHPSDRNCAFCAKKGSCKARTESVADAMQAAFATGETVGETEPEVTEEKFDLPSLSPTEIIADLTETRMVSPVEELDDETLARLVDIADLLIAYGKDAKREASRRLMEGQNVPNWKMVAGRRTRALTVTQEELENRLKKWHKLAKKDVYETKLMSLASLEKVIMAKLGPRQLKEFEELWAWKDGAPVLAPLDDPKEAVNRPADMFAPVEAPATGEAEASEPDWW